jgi:hypothetical protein
MPDPILGDQQFIPNPLVDSQRTRFYRDPVSGNLSVQYSKDSGVTWREFISQPSSIATEGWIPTLDSSANVVWRPINSLISLSAGTQDTNSRSQKFLDFYYPGSLFSGKTFGYFNVPDDHPEMVCYGIQITFFIAPSDGNTIIELREDSLNQLVEEIIIPPGNLFFYKIFNNERPFIPGSELRLKLSNVPQDSSGEFMTCRLLFR